MNPSLIIIIIIIPNAVKAGKLYSVIPTNGAGDLTLTVTGTVTDWQLKTY